MKHKDGCTPLILNPEVLKPKSTFDIVAQVDQPEGTYNGPVPTRPASYPYFVEQKRWNKWVKVGEVMGVGTPGEHGYEFKVTPHSGENNLPRETGTSSCSRYSIRGMSTDASVALVTWELAQAEGRDPLQREHAL